ncbi:uncharacterized protein K441DRAFT_202126 [Cenococcum geophilum 1.58]|uniref:uncharacterized protein n=1 Tax=Cenococcum geophilum 1.58 TaxID=794803 RepID=UPI00358E66B6|nr:hypothetical protein K441DRAFT_202126 [Cenococcum geophilum 1.58]
MWELSRRRHESSSMSQWLISFASFRKVYCTLVVSLNYEIIEEAYLCCPTHSKPRNTSRLRCLSERNPGQGVLLTPKRVRSASIAVCIPLSVSLHPHLVPTLYTYVQGCSYQLAWKDVPYQESSYTSLTLCL